MRYALALSLLKRDGPIKGDESVDGTPQDIRRVLLEPKTIDVKTLPTRPAIVGFRDG